MRPTGGENPTRREFFARAARAAGLAALAAAAVVALRGGGPRCPLDSRCDDCALADGCGRAGRPPEERSNAIR